MRSVMPQPCMGCSWSALSTSMSSVPWRRSPRSLPIRFLSIDERSVVNVAFDRQGEVRVREPSGRPYNPRTNRFPGRTTMSHPASTRVARTVFGVCTIVLGLTAPSLRAQKAEPAAPPRGPHDAGFASWGGPSPNYDLAAQWTAQKVGKLVFDTTVSPQWLETSDRFWYSYRTREGRRFMIVDPI